jgi:NAD-dependent SIR2 family protein deacetylase
MVIINKSTTDYDRLADLVIHDSVDLVLDAIVK